MKDCRLHPIACIVEINGLSCTPHPCILAARVAYPGSVQYDTAVSDHVLNEGGLKVLGAIRPAIP
jgi:hypothetical protein